MFNIKLINLIFIVNVFAFFCTVKSAAEDIAATTHVIIREDSHLTALTSITENLVIAGFGDGALGLYDISNEGGANCISLVSAHTDYIWQLVKLDHNLIASASSDATIKIWVIDEKRLDLFNCVATLEGHESIVFCLSYLGNGILASGSDDNTIKLWDINDLKSPKCIATLNGHEAFVNCLLNLNNGKFASGSDDDSILLWDINDIAKAKTLCLEGHTDTVSCMAMIDHGLFMSGSGDCTLQVWDSNGIDFTPKKTMQFDEPITAILNFENLILIGFKNGIVRILNIDICLTNTKRKRGSRLEEMPYLTIGHDSVFCIEQLGYDYVIAASYGGVLKKINLKRFC